MKRLLLLWGGIIGIGICAMCSAQVNRASLSGIVTDRTGAVVGNAKVTAVQSSTLFTFSTQTNGAGVYNFVGLPIGTYTVSGEHEGFEKIVRENVILDPSSDVRVDIQLIVGTTSETVEVKAESPLTAARTTTYGAELDSQAIQDLPLQVEGDIRGVYGLLAAVPGVNGVPGEGNGFASNVFGGVGFSSQLLVDGLGSEYDITVPGDMAFAQSVESIANFQVVQTSSAEYGLNGGGIMSVTTKSGTNDFHGAVFEYMRNEALDAKAFFAPIRPRDKEHDFGGTLGGPIRHNKTFFWGEFEGYRTNSGQNGIVDTLPTTAQIGGDFSQLLGPQIGTDALGRPIFQGAIYDPNTSRTVNGQNVRDPFPGNIIPSDRISPISTTITSDLPKATFPNQLMNNFLASVLNTTVENQYTGKVTQMIKQGTLDVSDRIIDSNNHIGTAYPPILSSANINNQLNYNLRASYSIPIGSRMTGNLLFGSDRLAGLGLGHVGGSSNFGITGLYSKNCSPGIGVQSMDNTAAGPWGTVTCDVETHDTNWKYSGTFAVSSGRHNMKFGSNYFRWLTNSGSPGGQGSFGFAATETGEPGPFLAQTGWGYASFLLGEVDTAGLVLYQATQIRNWEWGLFAEDEYRLTQRLTVNYGVRYDYQPLYTVPGNYQSQFSPLVANPGAGGTLGGLEFAGYGPGKCNCSRFDGTYKWGFAPRLGFAYELNHNTVVRGSYGLYYLPVAEFTGATQDGYFPVSSLQDEDGGITPVLNWENGYPPINLTPTLTPDIANGQAVHFAGPNSLFPQASSYPGQVQLINFSVQHQFPGDIVVEAAYLGNLGHHIAAGYLSQVNQLDFGKYGYLGNILNEDVYSTDAVNAGIAPPWTGFTGTVAQAIRPEPAYQNVREPNGKIGNNVYHALQVKATKRFTNGLSFLVGYTLSKDLSDTGGVLGAFSSGIQNTYNRKAEYAVSGADQRNMVVATYTYELPVGTGKRFLSGSNPAEKYAVGGWKLSGIHNYASGTPVGLSTNLGWATTTAGIRPNIVPGVNPHGTGDCRGATQGIMLNAAAFADPAPFTFGDAPPLSNNLRVCPSLSEDLSLLKEFPVVKDRVKISAGADFFNAFNRHEFTFNSNIDSGQFGEVNGATAAGQVRSGSPGGRQGQVHLRVQF